MKLSKDTLIEGQIIKKGTELKIKEDDTFNYQMLGRLLADVKYAETSGSFRNLFYSNDPVEHYEEIERLYNLLSMDGAIEWFGEDELEYCRKILL